MKKIRLLPIILIVCTLVCCLSPAALALDDPEISVPAAILGDPVTGSIYFERMADARMYPASMTKVMTILLAVEAVEEGRVALSDEVTATQNCMHDMVAEGSTANIVPGETMTLENLLYCTALSSANEACNIIAEYISGSIGSFVSAMNERAAALGCEGTHFTNPHGLPDEQHYTTARDMFKILSEALQHSFCYVLLSTVTHTVPATNVSGERELGNTNGLINANSKVYQGYLYEYAKAGKTGYTSAAGYCLASSAEKDGVSVAAVVMGGQSWTNADGSVGYGSFVDSITLYNWLFNNFSVKEILNSAEIITTAPVAMAAGSSGVALRPREVITALLPNDLELDRFTRSYTIYSERNGETLKAPIAAGTVLGEVTVYLDGVAYGTAPLVSATGVELSKVQYLRHQLDTVLNLFWVKLIFWVLMACLALYIVLVIRYRALHRRHLRDVQRANAERERRQAQARANQQPPDDGTRVFTQSPLPRTPQTAQSRQQPRPSQPQSPSQPQAAPPQSPNRPPVTTAASRDYFEEFFRQDNGHTRK